MTDSSPEDARRILVMKALRHRASGPHLMGIVNVTNDSFYSGSRALEADAVQRALAMWDAGATWVDIGGESTRPGADTVTVNDELARVIPVIEGIRQGGHEGLISVDTRRSEVAEAALIAGADMVNDVSGLRDPAMRDVVLRHGCAVCIMHMQGDPTTMQANPQYKDVVKEVSDTLRATADALVTSGHPPSLILLDPGIGFGKTHEHNMALLADGRRLGNDRPYGVLWGVSRKSIIGRLTGHTRSEDRLHGTLGMAAVAQHQGIDVLRVHDVSAHVDLLACCTPFISPTNRPTE
jgi:dihydropteroate synthase